MDDKDLSQKVLEEIKEKQIDTKPRWEFLLKDYFIWFLFSVAVIIGSSAMSVIIFIYKNNALSSAMKELGISKGMFELPYFWLLILLLFIVIAYYNFRYTKQGYKYNVYLVFLSSIVISVIFGFILYYLKGGEQLEQAFYQRVPFYQQMIHNQGRVWLAPEEGRLAGVVTSGITSDEEFVGFQLKSFNGNDWRVFYYSLGEETDRLIWPGSRIILVGEMRSPDSFLAEQILPWFAPPKRMIRFHEEMDERNNLPPRNNR